MDKRTIILVISFFLLIVVGMFVFAYLKRTEMVQPPVVTPPAEEQVLYPSITAIDAKHFFIDGVHTFAGEIVLPTPCDLLEVEAVVAESFPEQISLNFNVINNSEMCAQVMTTQRFMATANASSEATVRATFVGRHVELNLIPAAEGETPEEFELFIKG
jgi:type 1 fimbria pilin